MTTAQGAPARRNEMMQPGVKVGSGGGKKPGTKSLPASTPKEKPHPKERPTTHVPSQPGMPSNAPACEPVQGK